MAATTGVAVGKGQPDPPRSDAGTAHGKAVGQTAPAPTPARGQPRALGRTKRGTAPATGGPSRGGSAPTGGNSGGHGANVTGPYDPSGVGLPSGNGRSESNNGNRPCAGCVGKADAKNPPGQLPGGSDSNRGYECDENQGIGKTNPAHSGCSSPTNPVTPGLPRGNLTTALPLITPAVVAGVPALVADGQPGGRQQEASPEDDPRESAGGGEGTRRQSVQSVKASPGDDGPRARVHRAWPGMDGADRRRAHGAGGRPAPEGAAGTAGAAER